jgi:cation/acetate symporter
MAIDKGGNMAAPLLAEYLGGPVFLGFLAAVAFATILAVVAGLTLAGASALSHDLYVGVIRRGVSAEKEEVKVAKIATICLGVAAMLLAMLFKGQNVAFMVGLAFAIAASANFPALLLSLMWSRFTTKGAVFSIYTGMVLAVVLIVLSPTVYVDIIHKDEKAAVEKQVKEFDAKIAAADAQIAALQQQLISADTAAAMKPRDRAAAAKKNAGIQASIDGAARDRDALAARKKDANAKMPVAPVKYKNPGIFSMGAAFLVGIILSLLFPEKSSADKFAEEKLRSYVGIGAE